MGPADGRGGGGQCCPRRRLMACTRSQQGAARNLTRNDHPMLDRRPKACPAHGITCTGIFPCVEVVSRDTLLRVAGAVWAPGKACWPHRTGALANHQAGLMFVRLQTANEGRKKPQPRQQLYGRTTGRGESRAGLWPSERYTRIIEEGARDVVPLQEVLPRRALKAAPE